MKLTKEQEVKFKEVNETVDYLKEMVTELGPSNGHLRLVISVLDKVKRTLKNWSTQ